ADDAPVGRVEPPPVCPVPGGDPAQGVAGADGAVAAGGAPAGPAEVRPGDGCAVAGFRSAVFPGAGSAAGAGPDAPARAPHTGQAFQPWACWTLAAISICRPLLAR